MNWNLFWGLWCLAFAVAIWVCAWAMCFSRLGMERRCTSHALGRVVRWSAVRYAGFHIPLVEYEAGGRTYKVAGPKFTSAIATAVSTPFEDPKVRYETNLTTREDLPTRLRVREHRNSLASAGVSPLAELYPIGSEADVYYNPLRPKEAFVQRFEGVSRFLLVLFAVFGVLTTALALFFFFGPEIVMH